MLISLCCSDQIAAAFEGFFWPKIFWDFATTNLDPVVKPVPILQLLNLFFGIFTLAFEWPLGFFKGKSFHRAVETRLVMYPLFALAALIMYQSTNPGIYYIIGLIAYFWAYSEGEVSVFSLQPSLKLSLLTCFSSDGLP